jgi:outer membrane lipoprotein-sorting protein
MKRVAIILILIFASAPARSESLQEILRKQAVALGGWEKLAKIKSYVIKTDIDAGGMKGKAVSYFKAPDRSRTDLSLSSMSYSQGCRGEDCWLTDEQGLTHSLGAELKGMIVTESAIDEWKYLDSVRFEGELQLSDSIASVGDSPCYVIKIAPRGGIPAEIYVDKATFLTKQVAMATDMGTIYTRFDDYRSVAGVMVPYYSVENSEAGLVAGISTVTSFEFNVSLPDSLFMPDISSNQSQGLGTDVDSVIIPFELFRNHIFVKVWISGKGPFDFIFDTGAGGVGISQKLLAGLALEHLGATEARGVGGTDASDVYRIDSLRVGEIRLTDLSGFGVDFGSIESTGWRKIDGVIGYDLLSRFVISVDYANHVLIVYRKDTSPRPSWGVKCALTLDFRLPYIDAVINDSIPGRFRLDTGSHSSVDLNSPFVQAHHLIASDSTRYHAVTAFGIGGGSSGLVGLLPSLELCHSRLESLYVSFSTSESGIFAGANTAGNIGAGILKGFTVTFDYNRESVYFRESAELGFLKRIRNMAGIEIAEMGKAVMITGVLPGRAGDSLLLVSDEIIAIDGAKVEGKPIDEVNRLLIGERGTAATLKIKRGGGTLLVRIVFDSLY